MINLKNKFVYMMILLVIIPKAYCEFDEYKSGENENNAIEISVEHFFLLNQSDFYAAIKFGKRINNGEGGYEYTCYWKDKSIEKWNEDNTHVTLGRVYEDYDRVQVSDDVYRITNNRGQTFIHCNNISVEWSFEKWVYLVNPRGKVNISLTNEKELENIDFFSPLLDWK
ncbi:MAG: hypothetical protein R3F25_04880 [Gammaproteobacteria bacterium]